MLLLLLLGDILATWIYQCCAASAQLFVAGSIFDHCSLILDATIFSSTGGSLLSPTWLTQLPAQIYYLRFITIFEYLVLGFTGRCII
ncbi:hypothetical protein KHA80_14610 [Anaerobacillus sp. HL2]|nr:hypothetical protein KHA80_14610 [Anaerobacillus sp. HL2]